VPQPDTERISGGVDRLSGAQSGRFPPNQIWGATSAGKIPEGWLALLFESADSRTRRSFWATRSDAGVRFSGAVVLTAAVRGRPLLHPAAEARRRVAPLYASPNHLALLPWCLGSGSHSANSVCSEVLWPWCHRRILSRRGYTADVLVATAATSPLHARRGDGTSLATPLNWRAHLTRRAPHLLASYVCALYWWDALECTSRLWSRLPGHELGCRHSLSQYRAPV